MGRYPSAFTRPLGKTTYRRIDAQRPRIDGLMHHGKGKRPRPVPPPPAPRDRGLHGDITNASGILPAHDVDALIDGACELLRDTGCAFEAGTEAIALFRAAGCAVGADG